MDDQVLIEVYGNTNLPEGTPERPLVTFAVFAYNQEKYIREAVEGAFAQTYSPLEIILSDDASTDSTFEIIRRLAKEYRGNHKIIVRRPNENQGVLRHVLEVFRLASGKYVVCAAGDDVSLPERTSTLVNCFKNVRTNVEAIYSNSYKINDLGDIKGKMLWRKNSLIHGATAVYKRETFLGLPNPKEKLMAEDLIFTKILYLIGKDYAYIDKPLVLYRQTPQALSNFTKDNDFLQKLRRQCEYVEKSLSYVKQICNNVSYISKWKMLSLKFEHNAARSFLVDKCVSLSWLTLLYIFARARWMIPLVHEHGSEIQKNVTRFVDRTRGVLRAWLIRVL